MNLTRYIIVVALTAFAIAASSIWWLYTENRDLRDELTITKAQVSACSGRLRSVLDDVRSDNEIDNIPSDGLRDVPDHWLLPLGPRRPAPSP